MSHGPRADGMVHQQMIFQTSILGPSSQLQPMAKPRSRVPSMCTLECHSTRYVAAQPRHFRGVDAPASESPSSGRQMQPSGHGSSLSSSFRSGAAAARCTSRGATSGSIDDASQPHDGLQPGPPLYSWAHVGRRPQSASSTSSRVVEGKGCPPVRLPRTERCASPKELTTKNTVTARPPWRLRSPIPPTKCRRRPDVFAFHSFPRSERRLRALLGILHVATTYM